MNQPQRIFKNTVALTISDLLQRGGQIVLAFIISRMLHANGLGIYSAAMAYYGVIALAGAMGATSFLVREIAKDLTKTSRYISHLSVLGVTISSVIIVLLVAVLPSLPYSSELATSMYVILLALIPGTLLTIQSAVFIAHQRVEFVTITKLISVVTNLSISLYLLVNGYGVISLLIAFVIEQYLVMICYFYFINRFITKLYWDFEFSYIPILVREIKTFAALSILAGLFAQPEVIILSIVQDETEVGYYSAALKIVSLWHFIPAIYMTNVFPVLSHSYHLADQKFQVIQNKSVKYLLVVSLPLTAGIIATAGPIISLFFGPGFEPSITVLQLLAWTIPLNALISVLWRVLAARNQQSLDLQARVITLFVRLGGGYVLVSLLATLGAALTVPASLLLNTLLLMRYVSQDGTKFNLFRLSWRCALAATGMGMITWAFSQSLQLWVLVPLAAAVYGLLAFVFRVFSADDVVLFRKIWQPRVAEGG